MSADEPALHFGLGKDTAVDEITVHWPSGIMQRLEKVEAGRRYVITEGGAEAKPDHAPWAAWLET